MTAYRIPPPPPGAFVVTSRRLKREKITSASHLDFIRSLPCLVTGSYLKVEAAHVSYEQAGIGKLGRGKGQKEEDCWTVPLCKTEHDNQHAIGDEKEYWRQVDIDPCQVALALWRCTGDRETALLVLEHARSRR